MKMLGILSGGNRNYNKSYKRYKLQVKLLYAYLVTASSSSITLARKINHADWKKATIIEITQKISTNPKPFPFDPFTLPM